MAIQVNTLKKQAESPEPEKPVEEKSSPKKKKESNTGKEKEKTTKEKDPVKEERKRRVIGYSLLVLSTYIILAQISYIFTWDADYSQISSVGIWEIINGQTPMRNLMGSVGAAIAHLLIYRGFGVSSILITVALLVLSLRFTFKSIQWKLDKFFRWSTYLLVWSSVTFGLITSNAVDSWSVLGGNFGRVFSDYLATTIGIPGESMLLLLLLAAFTTITWNIPYRWLKPLWEQYKEKAERNRLEKENNQIRVAEQEGTYNPEEYAVKDDEEEYEEGEIKFYKRTGESEPEPKVNRMNNPSTVNQQPQPLNNKENEIELEVNNSTSAASENKKNTSNIDDTDLEIVNPTTTFNNQSSPASSLNPDNSVNQPSADAASSDSEETDANTELHHTIDEPYDPTLDLPQYLLPATELLLDYGPEEVEVQKDELEANKKRIVETLGNYQITIQKIKATIGPTVTLYEIVPSPGIRISKIKNLEDDIALSLSALGIRIIAPIPGKGTIGIEVPNQNPKIVSMRSMLANEKFISSKFELPIAIGKTIANEPFITDLAKMPHLLMAGATGQGKSVGLNAIIASLLYKKHPSQLKFVMVDPKKVELTLFSKIERHYLAKLPDSEEAIITDTHKVVKTLNSLTIEMNNRYELLKDAQVRNIKEYNAKFIARRLNPLQGHRYLPYIVLVVDEFADLIMTAGREIETPIARLAQLARAIGIHLIIATQRPSVNIITGTIKANFPARIAFRVSSKIDSRTILDASGAEQLIGRGDMLLSTGNDLIRLQCAFIDTPEIDGLTDFIGSQRGYSDALLLPPVADDNEMDEPKDLNPDERDEMFEEAARVIVMNQQGSTSLLQRKLKLGYNRAGRIIDQLEAAGIVGPFEGSKAREVKIPTEAALEQYLQQLRRENNSF